MRWRGVALLLAIFKCLAEQSCTLAMTKVHEESRNNVIDILQQVLVYTVKASPSHLRLH